MIDNALCSNEFLTCALLCTPFDQKISLFCALLANVNPFLFPPASYVIPKDVTQKLRPICIVHTPKPPKAKV